VFTLTVGRAADEWEAYFKARGNHGAAKFMRHRVSIGAGYAVPTEWPDQHDPTWKRRGTSWVDRSQPKER
jgi:hypothetical protein